jgi:hypothetical protein
MADKVYSEKSWNYFVIQNVELLIIIIYNKEIQCDILSHFCCWIIWQDCIMKTSVLRGFKDLLPVSTAITKNWTGSLGKEPWIFQACYAVSLYSLAGDEYMFVNGDLSLVNTAHIWLLHRCLCICSYS